jgi:hypothetical protein
MGGSCCISGPSEVASCCSPESRSFSDCMVSLPWVRWKAHAMRTMNFPGNVAAVKISPWRIHMKVYIRASSAYNARAWSAFLSGETGPRDSIFSPIFARLQAAGRLWFRIHFAMHRTVRDAKDLTRHCMSVMLRVLQDARCPRCQESTETRSIFAEFSHPNPTRAGCIGILPFGVQKRGWL